MNNSRKKEIFKKIIASLIVIVMVFYCVPISVFAEKISQMLMVTNEEEVRIPDMSMFEELNEEEPTVIGELTEERTLTQKHFLMSDGTMLASIFPSNIHYEKDGRFLDISNTLEEVTDTTESLKRIEKTQSEIQNEIIEPIEQEDSVVEDLEIDSNVIEEENIEDAILETQEEVEVVASQPETSNKALDSRLEAERNKETKVYTNKTGNANITFTNKTSGYNLGSMESKGYTITWGLLNSRASDLKVTNSEAKANKIEGKKASEIEIHIPQTTLEYADILENINIRYSVEPERIKEDIVLANKTAINNELQFIYNVASLKMKLLEDKNIIVYDGKEDNVIFTIQAPFMYDNNTEFSGDIELKLEEQGYGTYILTLIPSKEWLEAEERIYPVTIDPSINTSLYWSDIQDTFIYPGDQGNMTRGGAQVMRVGNGWENPCRPMIKFTLPQELKSGDQVIGAYLSLVNYSNMDGFVMPTDERIINVHKITADWGEHTATWNNSCNNYDTRVVDYNRYKYNGTYQAHMWDITSIAKEWYTTGNNYGVMLKEPTEYTAGSSVKHPVYFSSDTNVAWIDYRPMVQIIYRNQTGLEDYLSYHSVDVGRAGTVYTNDYNGNVTLIHSDLSTPGQRLPASIYHVYNTNDKDIDIGYGYGFRLNLSQMLEVKNIGGTEYIEYIDEDGTRHYFTYNNGVWKDEDGLNLEIRVVNGLYQMTDKGGNKLVFVQRWLHTRTVWCLSQIIDENGNTINISLYDVGNNNTVISTVTDATGNNLTLSYSGQRLHTMTDPGGKTLTYSYYVAGTLAQIMYPDGVPAQYDYNASKLLITVNNCGKGAIGLEYTTAQTNRVRTIIEYSSAWELGSTLAITYGNNVTKFTDNNGYAQSVNFSNWGQAIGVVDQGKTANSIIGAYGINYEYGTGGGAKNKLTLDGKLIQSANNLLYNSGAEQSTNVDWLYQQWGANPGTSTITTEIAYSGKKSLKVESIYNNNVTAGWGQVLNAKKGETYTLSTQVKTMNMTNTNYGGARILLTYINTNGQYATQISDPITGTTDWQKISVTLDYQADAATPLYAYLMLYSEKGIVYYDEVQLEVGKVASPYNYIENGGFEDRNNAWKNWIGSNITYGPDSCVLAGDGVNQLIKLSGEVNKDKLIYQDVAISGKAGDTYTYSAWIKVRAVPTKTGVCTTMPVNIVSTTGQEGWIGHGINTDTEEWQYVSYQFVAPHDYNKIQVYLCYYQNANEMYIDNVSLIKDESGNSFSYDANGNLISSKDLAKQNSAFQYDGNNNLIKSINPRGGSFTYTYDTTYKHRLLKGTSSLGIDYNFGYNGYGQNTSIKTTGNGSEFIENKATYSANGRYLETLEDERGNTTTYTTNNSTGTISKITNANQTETNYMYDALNRVISVDATNGTDIYQNNYTYSNDKLNTISHNNTTYSFVYDTFGNTKQVKVGNQTLITNNYAVRNGNLTSSVYGNNQTISYTYDRFNRILTTAKNQGTYSYEYDARGNLATTKSPEGIVEKHTYDLADRLIKTVTTTGLTKSYTYDQNSAINTAKYAYGTQTNTTTYNFSKENRISSVDIGASRSIQLNYDGLSRTTSRVLNSGANNYTTSYTYLNTSTANKTTTMIESLTNGNEQLSYTYDTLGNIETISRGGQQTQKYYYDALSQLIREDNLDLNKTIEYCCDLGGNITVKKEYTYTTAPDLTNLTPTNTINYMYGNSNWKDQLTNYNGQAITYDAIGNPTSYNGNIYTWQNGRELAALTNTTQNLSIEYKYNESGIRRAKVVNGVVYRYHLEGTKVIYETIDGSNDIIYYSYDEGGSLIGMNRNNVQYFYVKNLQGDITGILDNNLQQVVVYTYDSWGKLISTKDASGNDITSPTHIGNINPYLYRSYRYDRETGLYYLQSRYYNPEWGRFLNGDNYGGQVGVLLSHNIYAYCMNNPINASDPSGYISISIPGTGIDPFSYFIWEWGKAFDKAVLKAVETLDDIGRSAQLKVGNLVRAAEESISKAMSKPVTITRAPPREPQYWTADSNAVQGSPLSYSGAKKMISTGQNVLCRNQIAAMALVGGHPGRVIHKPHQTGYYYHYHLNAHVSSPHIWFYGPVVSEQGRIRD